MTPSLLVVNPGQSNDSVQYCQQDDSEDDTEEGSDANVQNRKRNLSFSFEKTPKRRRLSSSRSSISSSGVMDFGYALSPGFKIK